ncbi:hypothetical protein [Mesorhizobium ventifaucium]|uniref:Propionyl-coenzyme A carboxylase alpha polypeptide n=1 Tax=Mesorhizobium ventifaucium TaxID=666020 RepID=A0ABM9E6Q3_9HYPH|nr:hypothetical protein [Mesorhizobium ventifaucium]CAH2404437.1 conserved hypothetical protein [Mesorhizobium ventifaucium]
MFVTVGSGAVKLNAPLINASKRRGHPGLRFLRPAPPGERNARPPSIHKTLPFTKRGTDHARQENTDVDR